MHCPPITVQCSVLICPGVFDCVAQDPLLLKYAEYFSRVFPSSKWVFIVRDGRAVVHSIIKR